MLVCPTTFELIKIGDYDPPIEKNKTKKESSMEYLNQIRSFQAESLIMFV